jgi:hypothetical protein
VSPLSGRDQPRRDLVAQRAGVGGDGHDCPSRCAMLSRMSSAGQRPCCTYRSAKSSTAVLASAGASILAVGYALPLTYLIWSLAYGPIAPPNPWRAAGLEWQTPSPPPTPRSRSPAEGGRQARRGLAVTPEAGLSAAAPRSAAGAARPTETGTIHPLPAEHRSSAAEVGAGPAETAWTGDSRGRRRWAARAEPVTMCLPAADRSRAASL